ncbi:DUF1697 domain-containing protein [Leifsonia sp. NPDC058292]|uniref:DUF1697 domain-containing protein n=1 Tax=Leifsonia sp. NPDC058292 TaxID=3346428 RepID=UPI0036D91BCB
MSTKVVLIRGVNVGGKNPVAMAGLRECLEELGCTDVTTYLNSGNAVVDSSVAVKKLAASIQEELPRRFHLHDVLVKVLVLPAERLRAVVDDRPTGFGDKPDEYHSDAIFLMDGLGVDEAMAVFDPREGVDRVWPGDGVVYSQRLSAERTRSRLGKIVGTPAYKSMTIRSWQTTTKLLALVDAR